MTLDQARDRLAKWSGFLALRKERGSVSREHLVRMTAELREVVEALEAMESTNG